MAKVQVGNCEVTLMLHRNVVHWGEQVTGTISLVGGQKDQRIRHLAVSLTGQSNGKVTAGVASPDLQPKTWADFAIRAGERRELPVRINVEWGSCLGTACSLHLRVVGGAFWQTETEMEPLAVLPPIAIHAMATEVAVLTGFALHRWVYAQGDGVRGCFEPTVKAHPRLDRLELEIFRTRGRLHGALTFDVRGRKPFGPLKSVPVSAIQSLPFQLYWEDLENGPALMRQLLKPYLVGTADLPIPAATPPPTTGQLPRPASAVDQDTWDLPRVDPDA